jgi:putative ABC transport system permease protein
MNLRDFRVGWRVLAREPGYSAVVVLGLAVGIAACFLLLGFVRHSFSYDRNVPQRERVMRLMERWHLASLGDEWSAKSSVPARDAALHSGQPLLAAMVIDNEVDVRAAGGPGARVQSIHLSVVDPDFQAIFAPPVLAGDLRTALARPDTIALTRETAIKLFGRADVLGKSVRCDDQLFTVAAVLADAPAATTLPYDALAGSAGILPERRASMAQSWGRTPGRVYLKLLPGADPEAVLAAVRRGLRQSPLSMRDKIEYRLSPLADAYLDPDLKDSSRLHGDRRLILGLAAVAVLILLLAATNYVNLATVRVLARQREIAVRKVLGATAPAVARQFLAESVLVCLIATVLGLLLAWLVLPLFADLVQRRFDRMFDAAALGGALLLALLLGLAAGAWPAWSALRVRPSAALAGRAGSETVRGLWARRLLTTLQFGVAMGLTGTTLAVAWQTHYASLLSPGFDAAPLLTFAAPHAMSEPATRAFREALVRLPGVAAVGESSMPITFNNNILSLHREGGEATDLNLYSVSPEFFQVLGLQAAAGRLYDPARDRMSDRDRVVVNASGARKLGFATPEDAVGREVIDMMGVAGKARALQIVGVAPDIRHRSARSGQQPSVFYLGDWVNVFMVRCSRDPAAVRRQIEDLWPRHFPDATFDIRRMPAYLVDTFYADDLRLAKLLGVASVIATAIAAFGIYVLAAYSVQRREKEIVLRKLYGAGSGAIGGLVAREFALLVGAGAVLGLPLAWLAIARYLGAFSERAPIGAWTLLAALLVAGAVALLSTLRHALAALRIRPALALRE